MYPRTSCLPYKMCVFHSVHLGFFPPRAIYPLLNIGPHFLPMSVEILPKYPLKPICWFSKSVRPEIGKTQTSLLHRSPMLEMIFPLCISCAFIAHSLVEGHYPHRNHYFSSPSLCMVLEGTGFCASLLFPEHFTWQLAHGRCPHLLGMLTTHLTGPPSITTTLPRSCFLL